MLNIFLIILACILSGVLGRMGGSGNYPRQMRAIGIPLLSMLLALILGVHSWWLLLAFGLMAGAISTYWDWLFRDEDNFWFHGFVIGLSLFPVAIVTGHWWGFLGAVALLTAWMGLWSKILTWDVGEEFMRYLIVPVGILLIV